MLITKTSKLPPSADLHTLAIPAKDSEQRILIKLMLKNVLLNFILLFGLKCMTESKQGVLKRGK